MSGSHGQTDSDFTLWEPGIYNISEFFHYRNMSTVDVDVTKSKDASNPSNKYVISETQLGIWKIFIAKKGAQSVLSEIWETYPLIIRLIVDIYTISPRLLYLLLLTRCWDGVELALQMRLENILLAQVNGAVVNRCYLLMKCRSSLLSLLARPMCTRRYSQ